ncbi:Serum albumin-like protein [Dioscorea alata]|uniref:Serum albumin-like protein n=1 Tax=Dioscorea alata TaxID=55571 RepID=A0ACB7V618_DIOAL|nr:Serum albumin-like protein [Dioscorea alata]
MICFKIDKLSLFLFFLTFRILCSQCCKHSDPTSCRARLAYAAVKLPGVESFIQV